MTYGKCDACGRVLLHGLPQIEMGDREFCGPVTSECHELGLMSEPWRLTAAEGAALLAADVAALAGQGVEHLAA